MGLLYWVFLDQDEIFTLSSSLLMAMLVVKMNVSSEIELIVSS